MIKKLKLSNKKLRLINLLLVGLIVLINGYVLVSPLLPQFDLWRRQHHVQAVAGLPYKTNLDKTSPKADIRAQVPIDNRIVIPKLALNDHIYIGANPNLVNKGVWARPNASTPPNGSNTVLVAHRFSYNGSATFYSLNKVGIGDKIVVYWQGQEYDYTVFKTSVADATDLAVENPSPTAQLTLYTCTPLWNPIDRLVVVASLDRPLP